MSVGGKFPADEESFAPAGTELPFDALMVIFAQFKCLSSNRLIQYLKNGKLSPNYLNEKSTDSQ
jgi:hypothetical protein